MSEWRNCEKKAGERHREEPTDNSCVWKEETVTFEPRGERMRRTLFLAFLFSMLAVLVLTQASAQEHVNPLERVITMILPPPKILLPQEGKVFHNYPRKLLIKWQGIPGAGIEYDLEVDCMDCRKVGEWASETGTPWFLIEGLKTTYYELTFGGDNPGRVRVRAVKGPVRGPWSPWRSFFFRTSSAIREDCITIDPETIEVKNISGHWKVVQGSMWILDFGNNMCHALEAYRIIRHYRLTRQCFVGRPRAPFEYWLVKNEPPAGLIDGEDCISFDPSRIEVKKIISRWKIIDGTHWLFDFGSDEAKARLALRIIKKYGFNHSCFVGRPDAPMEYLRR